jgi:hypothetical protein
VLLTLTHLDMQSLRKHRSFFNETHAIYVPPTSDMPRGWTNLNSCLWEAPSTMISKWPLRARYATMVPGNHTEVFNVERLFFDVLGIRNCDWKDLIQELIKLRDTSCEDFDRIHDLLAYLAQLTAGMSRKEISEIR